MKYMEAIQFFFFFSQKIFNRKFATIHEFKPV